MRPTTLREGPKCQNRHDCYGNVNNILIWEERRDCHSEYLQNHGIIVCLLSAAKPADTTLFVSLRLPARESIRRCIPRNCIVAPPNKTSRGYIKVCEHGFRLLRRLLRIKRGATSRPDWQDVFVVKLSTSWLVEDKYFHHRANM